MNRARRLPGTISSAREYPQYGAAAPAYEARVGRRLPVGLHLTQSRANPERLPTGGHVNKAQPSLGRCLSSDESRPDHRYPSRWAGLLSTAAESERVRPRRWVRSRPAKEALMPTSPLAIIEVLRLAVDNVLEQISTQPGVPVLLLGYRDDSPIFQSEFWWDDDVEVQTLSALEDLIAAVRVDALGAVMDTFVTLPGGDASIAPSANPSASEALRLLTFHSEARMTQTMLFYQRDIAGRASLDQEAIAKWGDVYSDPPR